jgi:coproporphyrinogen III oxidase-like Fe-S oxidoreductase
MPAKDRDVAGWRTELTRALKLPIEHVSLYQLTIEAGTAFARRVDQTPACAA